MARKDPTRRASRPAVSGTSEIAAPILARGTGYPETAGSLLAESLAAALRADVPPAPPEGDPGLQDI